LSSDEIIQKKAAADLREEEERHLTYNQGLVKRSECNLRPHSWGDVPKNQTISLIRSEKHRKKRAREQKNRSSGKGTAGKKEIVEKN